MKTNIGTIVQVSSKRKRAFDLFRGNAFAMTIAGSKINQTAEDQQRHHSANDEQEDEKRVDVPRYGGSPVRP